jgi:DNA invertase Pin-like site-specific DNA recombinase
LAVIYRLIGRINQNEVLQKTDLQVFAQSANLIIQQEFIDNFFPYQQEKRQQLKLLMEAARSHKFTCLLIWKLDCLACSLIHLSQIFQEFHALQIRFISVKDNMNLIHQKYLPAIHVIQKMIEFKSALVKERVKEGMRKARQNGQIIGRPSTSTNLSELVEELALHTDYSIKKIRILTGNTISYSTVGKIVKKVREESNLT